MQWLKLVLLSLTWLPLAGTPAQRDEDLVNRIHLAIAIVDADTTEHEGRILMRIARYESTYRRDVYECKKLGDVAEGTSVGPFQKNRPSPDMRERICGSLVEAARQARDDVRRSWTVCASNPKEERLAAYARGRCDSDEGKRLSRVRWAP